jgi:protein PhnA
LRQNIVGTFAVLQEAVFNRADNACELCKNTENLDVYMVPESPDETAGCAVLTCQTCRMQLNSEADIDTNHWRCLNDAMWSPTPAVQVVAYRMLNKISGESWAQDLLDMAYLEDDVKQWAEAGLIEQEATLDCNGTALQPGDNVHLVKDLTVKGANFTAKRGTPVRGISLSDNPLHIEGKVNGTRIVIIAAYTKKS